MLSKREYSYNGIDSIVSRLNPIVKILGLIVYLVVCLIRYDNLLFICNIVFVFILLLLSNVNMVQYLKIVWKMKYIVTAIYIIMMHYNFSINDISIVLFDFIFLVLYVMMLIYTTTIDDLAKASARIVDVFNLIGFNFKKIFYFFSTIYTYPGLFIDTYIDYFNNLEIKGKSYINSDVLDKFNMIICNIKLVFGLTNDKMKKRKNNMRYRLYNKHVNSKYKYRNKLCIFDYIFIIFSVGMVVYYILKVRM